METTFLYVLFKLESMEHNKTPKKDDSHSASWYRTLIKEVNDLATIIDTDGRITYVSPAVRRIFGYDPEELIGQEGQEFVHPDDQERNAEAVEAILSTLLGRGLLVSSQQ